jgi:hypothetical protein
MSKKKRTAADQRPPKPSPDLPVPSPPAFLDAEDLEALGLSAGIPEAPPRKERAEEPVEDSIRRIANIIHGHLQGKSERDLAAEFGVQLQTVKSILQRAYSREIDRWRSQDARSLFARYTMSLFSIFRDLQAQCVTYMADSESRQYSAFIQAKRTQVDILDRILDRGQRMGVLQAKPPPTDFVDGAPADQMSTRELEVSLYRELTVLRAVVGDVQKEQVFSKGFSVPWSPPEETSDRAEPFAPSQRTSRTIVSDKPARALYPF